ncbi:MAG: permease, partial [Pseudomonadota bacterium]
MSAAEDDATRGSVRHPSLRARIDGAWAASAAIVIAILVFAPLRAGEHLGFAADALLGTLPFIAFAVLSIAVLKATGAESLVARAFVGRETRMIFVAALAGGLSPFCSCEVIPFIAGLLALGAPLPAVMAFWLASPLMDPPAFLITAGALGWDFAIAKTIAAVGVGLLGGFAIKAL